MYKVFFKDRTVFFRDDFAESLRTRFGLFYKFETRTNLAEIVNAFFHLRKIDSLYLFHNDLGFLRNEFSSLFQPVHAAGGLVRNSKGEFLVIRRNGIWDLPKGKSESGESSLDAAVREVCEECGIRKPEVNRFLTKTYHAYQINGTSVLKETDWFEMSVNGSENLHPEEEENITEIRWFSAEDLPLLKSNTFPLILDVLYEARIF